MTNQYSYAEDFVNTRPEASQKKTATPNISSAAKVYMLSRAQKENVTNSYRSGSDNGQKYMTSEDFVTYFRNRQNSTSENVQRVAAYENARNAKAMSSVNDNRPGDILRSASGAMPTRENVERSRGNRPNVSEAVRINKSGAKLSDERVKIYTPKSNSNGKKSFETRVFSTIDREKLEKIKTVANDWLPKDEIVEVKRTKKDRKLPKIFLGLAGVAISLMLIVTGSVMLSDATRDVKQLENELRALRETENELKLELDMKNDVNVLRERATLELGLISKEYVEAGNLNAGGSDSIKAHADESADDKIGFSTILSAFGIN